ncbi:MAG: hypothetical protein KDJ22_11970 [Candidatus Competibacteraceae bacterium]|nr:hypothetical protein [Candidatus Competibacteraceae bacterium]MCP5125852.1 hypothetical protein [Gammaproteobacteria bacterium]HRX70512.1 hypothetical protein [Candidatus Competibacteraceae bacterium]
MNALPPPKTPWLGRIGVGLATVATVVIGFIAASFLFAILLTAGLIFTGFLWWQFRRLARAAQAMQPQDLEGEYTVESTQLMLEDQSAFEEEESHPDSPPRRSKPHKNRRASQSHY